MGGDLPELHCLSQFVAMKDFPATASSALQQQQLSRAVLEEVPGQVTSFMRRRGIHPKRAAMGSVRVK